MSWGESGERDPDFGVEGFGVFWEGEGLWCHC